MKLAVFALFINALLWGLSWWPFRALSAQGVHGLWSTALVYALIAAGVVWWDRQAPGLLWRRRTLWPLLLASGLTNAAFNWALTFGDVVRVVLLFYLMPAWAALLARWLLHERMNTGTLLRIALALAGAAVVLTPPGGAWPLPQDSADLLAILGGAGFAATNVLLRREAEAPESARALAMFVGGVLVAGGLAAVLSGVDRVAWPPAPQWTWLTGIAGLALMFAVGNLCLQYGAARLPANLTSLVLLSEVPIAALSAVWWGDERLLPNTLIGGAMILASVVLALRTSR